MSAYTVTLSGPAPWGFRLQGGKDFNMPLTISRITPGSKAAGGSLAQGDVISGIDGVTTDGMTHLEAQNKIKSATSKLDLAMLKSRRPNAFPTNAPSRMDSPLPVIPHQKEVEQEIIKEYEATADEPEMEEPVSCGIRLARRPSTKYLFQQTPAKKQPEPEAAPLPQPPPPRPSPIPVKPPAVVAAASPQSPALAQPGPPRGQYNTPIGLYSAETLREMAAMQGKLGEAGSSRLSLPGLEYTPNFNPIALKDSALSTHKPIEVRGPGGKATIVHAQYNTPISMYSQDAIMDAIAGQSQAKGHEGGALPIKEPVVDCASPVYQAVIRPGDRSEQMAEWARRAANLQSKSFRMLAHITGTEYMQDPDEEALQRSREKFESEVKGPRFAKLKNWHQGLSSQILNIQE